MHSATGYLKKKGLSIIRTTLNDLKTFSNEKK